MTSDTKKPTFTCGDDTCVLARPASRVKPGSLNQHAIFTSQLALTKRLAGDSRLILAPLVSKRDTLQALALNALSGVSPDVQPVLALFACDNTPMAVQDMADGWLADVLDPTDTPRMKRITCRILVLLRALSQVGETMDTSVDRIGYTRTPDSVLQFGKFQVPSDGMTFRLVVGLPAKKNQSFVESMAQIGSDEFKAWLKENAESLQANPAEFLERAGTESLVSTGPTFDLQAIEGAKAKLAASLTLHRLILAMLDR